MEFIGYFNNNIHVIKSHSFDISLVIKKKKSHEILQIFYNAINCIDVYACKIRDDLQ